MRGISTDKILNLIFHPAFLAIPFFVLIVIHGRISVSPYKLSLLATETGIVRGEKNAYIDLNSDSISELVKAYNLLTNATVIAYIEGQAIYEAWNLKGFWINERPDFEIFDLDRDGVMEMYALTISPEDSLWINRLELRQGENRLHSKFICQLERLNGQRDQDISLNGFGDITADGVEDVIFSISAGFTLQPRAFYAWDVSCDTFIRTDNSGINYKANEELVFSGRGSRDNSLIYAKTTSTDNYKTEIPYSDTVSYAVVLKDSLKYLFKPVVTGGRQSSTTTYPFSRSDSSLVLAIVTERRRLQKKNTFHLLNEKGHILESRVADEYDRPLEHTRFNNSIIVLSRKDEVTELGMLDFQLRVQKRNSFAEDLRMEAALDLDEDNFEELFLVDPDENCLIILQEDLKGYARIDLPPFKTGVFYTSLINNDKGKSQIFIQTSDAFFELEHSRSPLYKLRFIVYVFIYLSIFSFFLLLQKIFVFTNNRRRNREQKLLNYQLQSVMNQLNPHFTFNAINSIGYAIMEGRKEEAYDYFTKLSGLIRRSMKNAFIPYKSLAEEINFVKDYLEIEEYRFGGQFSWNIITEEDVDQTIPVPKMLIHIFTENSIKHGLFQLDGKGLVDVHIFSRGNDVVIIIKDNGIGYEATRSNENTTGKGLLILDNYLSIYNATMKRYISYQIADRKNDDGVSGTVVRISIE